jgi:hypothetical protein
MVKWLWSLKPPPYNFTSPWWWPELITSLLSQSLVQSRKAGITSAMATRTSLKDEELVSDSWAFVGLLDLGLMIISVAILRIQECWAHIIVESHSIRS